MVINVDKSKSTSPCSACHNAQHIWVYLQPFSH